MPAPTRTFTLAMLDPPSKLAQPPASHALQRQLALPVARRGGSSFVAAQRPVS